MPTILKDKYDLGNSDTKDLSNSSQVRIDLNLKMPREVFYAEVTGTVVDESRMPISGAVVHITDINNNPIINGTTNYLGVYKFENTILVPNVGVTQVIVNGKSRDQAILNIYAVANGKKISLGKQFTFTEGNVKVINFTMETDPDLLLGVVTGSLKDRDTKSPILGAYIQLMKQDSSGTMLTHQTFTNEEGDFALRGVDPGNYTVLYTALGYNPIQSQVSLSLPGQILSTQQQMSPNSLSPLGTVSGVITDENGISRNRADVILYRVESSGRLTPLAFTKTNLSGVYVFASVPVGTYKVKSNEFETVSVMN